MRRPRIFCIKSISVLRVAWGPSLKLASCKSVLKPWWAVRLETRRFNPRRGRQHSFVEIGHEIFSTVILSLPLIHEGQLSVSGERMCIILVNRLEDEACPVNEWLGKFTALDMTPLGWLGHKTSTQTNKTPVVYSTDRSKTVVPVLVLLFGALWFILLVLFYSVLLCLFYVLPCVILFLCFFSPFSFTITSLGEERANLSVFRTFVRFMLVWFCRLPLPLGVGRAAICDFGTPWTFLLPFTFWLTFWKTRS